MSRVKIQFRWLAVKQPVGPRDNNIKSQTNQKIAMLYALGCTENGNGMRKVTYITAKR